MPGAPRSRVSIWKRLRSLFSLTLLAIASLQASATFLRFPRSPRGFQSPGSGGRSIREESKIGPSLLLPVSPFWFLFCTCEVWNPWVPRPFNSASRFAEPRCCGAWVLWCLETEYAFQKYQYYKATFLCLQRHRESKGVSVTWLPRQKPQVSRSNLEMISENSSARAVAFSRNIRICI